MPNKPIHFLSFFVLSFFGIVSCDNNNSMNSTAVPEINIEFLYQTWLSSYEEGTDTFRPASYDFPPSRGRTGFTFLEDRLYGSLYGSDDEDGIYIVYQICPTDGLIAQLGAWRLISEKQILIFFPDPDCHNSPNYKVEIIELKSDLLKLKSVHKQN